jgi:23S rRNA-intervening sequence protein
MIYESTPSFPKQEMYGLTSQMRKASISVISNIAEGQGRLTAGEWRQRTRSAVVALKLRFMSDDVHAATRRQIKRTSVALNNFIDFVRNRESRKQT